MKSRVILAATLALALAGCAGLSTKQKVAVTCDNSASAMEAINAARVAEKISKADHAKALEAYKVTVPFCQPIRDNLSSADLSALIRAAASLAVTKKAVQP